MWGEVWRRVWYRLNRSRFERELQEEMAAHRELMGEGRAFGNTLRLREESRDAWGWGALDRFGEDVRSAARLLRRAPLFSITAGLILSVGIGLNLTFFHMLNVTTLRSPAVRDPESLVRFTRQTPHFFASGFPLPAAGVIRQNNDVLSAVLTRHRSDVVWEEDPSGRVKASFVSANWFDELGYQAALGRVFAEDIDTRPDAPLVVVLSHQFHSARLGSDPLVVGRQLRLNDRLVTVVGVAPPRFPDFDLDNTQLWLLMDQIDQLNPGMSLELDWTSLATELYGRLRPGISVAAATDGLQPAVLTLARLQPKRFKPEERFVGTAAADGFNSAHDLRQIRMTATLIAALTLLVLAVASANLANFVLSRAIGRLREFSIRTALGATRFRILRQMLVECAVLAGAGAAGGIMVSVAAARIIAARTELPPYLDFAPDTSLFAAAFVAAGIATLAVGAVPAWMVGRRDLARAMQDGGQQASTGLARARFRLALVGAQVLGCCALLVVAGAVFGGLRQLLRTDPGFRVDRAVVLDASLTRHGISGARARAYWTDVMDRLAAEPQIERIALASPAPLGGGITSAGYPTPAGLKSIVMQVGPDFFSALDIPLLGGRSFTDEDDESRVIVSRRLALEAYGSIDVIGKGFPTAQSKRTIVGVVGDAALVPRRGDFDGEEYIPMREGQYSEAVLVAKSRGGPELLLEPLRTAARFADERVLPKTLLVAPAYEARFRAPRLASLISGLVAALVLGLACLGIAGVVAYGVKVRTKEIGIRRALGADAPRLCGLLLRQLALPVSLGTVAGTAIGVAVTRLLAQESLHLPISDATPALAIFVFVLSALLAGLAPASRALSVDPVRALRHD